MTMLQSVRYKTIEGQQLMLDVHSFDDQHIRPVIFWIHGGALIMGGRPAPFLLDYFTGNGFIVVSFDYRLAPFVRMPEIYQDVHDAYRWTHEHIAQFHGDPECIVVGGESAGGYLTLAVGPALQPKPPVLFSLSGYGNIIAPWYSVPSGYYRTTVPLQERDAVYAALRNNPADWQAQTNFYWYARQNGQWPAILLGHDPNTEPAIFTPYCPIRHVTADFPPVVFTHCTGDTDVPYSEAETLAAQCQQAGIDYRFISLAGNGHASSVIFPENDKDGSTRKAIMYFLHKHLPSEKRTPLTALTGVPANHRPLQIVHDFRILGRQTGDVRAGLTALLAQGIGGVVVNMPFDRYMQDAEIWEQFREFLRCCRALEMRVWLYDEKGYPSGYAGGQVLAQCPELEAVGLYYDAATGTISEARSYEGTHNCNNYFAEARTSNLLEPEAIVEFIQVTHERYAASWGRSWPPSKPSSPTNRR